MDTRKTSARRKRVKPNVGSNRSDSSKILGKSEREKNLTARVNRENALPLLKVNRTKINLYTREQMVNVQNSEIRQNGLVGHGTVNDNAMGAVELHVNCESCGLIDCPGHYGYINFKRPIYNPRYIEEIFLVLSSVCSDCGGLLLDPDTIASLISGNNTFQQRLRAIKVASIKKKICTRKRSKQEGQGDILECQPNPTYILNTADGSISGGNRNMSVMEVYTILDNISPEDAGTLGFLDSHPRDMIMFGFLVPPPITRPPVYDGDGIRHDRMTEKLEGIFTANSNVIPDDNEQKSLSYLYNKIKEFIEGEQQSQTQKGPIFISIRGRIQGKEAVMRKLLMGKRVDYCGRTVAGPDPSLEFGQIRIPDEWKNTVTVKEIVYARNIKILEEMIKDGKITHIIVKATGLRKYCPPGISVNLKIGDIVERCLSDGDIAVFNRQPSLHKQSMMGGRVVLTSDKNVKNHLSITSPLNLDFDGDEINVHVTQDLMAKADASIIMNVKENIMSSEQNKPIMGMVMNSITSPYLLTDPATRIPDDLFELIINMLSNKDSLPTLYQRLKKYRIHPRSGQALFSTLLPEDFYYTRGDVKIKEGVLIQGLINKNDVGASHRSIIQFLYKKYGSERTSQFFTDAPWLLNRWIMENGFSVGLRDVVKIDPTTGQPSDEITRAVDNELKKMKFSFVKYSQKSEDPLEEDYRQRKINKVVDIARGMGLTLSKEVLAENNSIGIMSEEKAGTKGNLANIGQIMGSVGQQYFRGKRLQPAPGRNRLLPYFDENSNAPEAHGFVKHSFFQGLTPYELFFLQRAGREGLTDTSLKTADTGDMQRQMIKALESIVISNDSSVRNLVGTVFALSYNSGFGTSEVMMVDDPSFPKVSSFIDIKSAIDEINSSLGWIKSDLKEKIEKRPIPEYNEKILPKGKTMEKVEIPNVIDQPSKFKLTKYEKSRIVGARAMQIANNAPILIPDLPDSVTDPLTIALKEYELGLIKIYSIRKMPNGETVKIYPTLENI